MKNLTKLHMLLLMLLVSSAMIIGSCKKDDDEGDKTALNVLISEADVIANAATTAAYPQTAIDEFKATLQTVKTASVATLTQGQVDDLVTQLNTAMDTLASYGTDAYVQLNALITEADALANAATTADYPQSAIDTYKTTVQTVKTAAATLLTQVQVNNLIVQLSQATETFSAAEYDIIPASALLIGLSFDEGTGTQLTTEGKTLTALLTPGPSEIFGTDTHIPSFIDGISGKAMYFNRGSHLEINGYNAADFLINKMSVAVWVKPDSTRPGNYIVSYNYWNTWKFQIQEQNKPFYTVHTSAGWTDADNQHDFSAPNGEWTHIAISMDLVAETLDMYVNGINTMHWTTVDKPNLSGTPAPYATLLPILVGSCTTYAEAKAAWTWNWSETPDAWDHFVGAMDEFKIYNIALTDGQVSKLYNNEKP